MPFHIHILGKHGPFMLDADTLLEAIFASLENERAIESFPLGVYDDQGQLVLDRENLEAAMEHHREEWDQSRKRKGLSTWR